MQTSAQKVQENKLCPEYDKSLVFHGEGIIFPINAKNPGSRDHEVASAITKVIFDVVSGLEPRKTPISWFKFEQLIQKIARDDGKRILHWKECLGVARLLHEVVKFHYKLRHDPHSHTTIRGEWQKV